MKELIEIVIGIIGYMAYAIVVFGGIVLFADIILQEYRTLWKKNVKPNLGGRKEDGLSKVHQKK